MDIQIDKNYDNIATLIRNAAIVFYNKNQMPNYAPKLIQTTNQLKYYAYPTTLINNLSDPTLSSALKTHLTSNNAEKLVLEMNQEDSHFIDSIGVSDIDKNVDKIFVAYNNFYNCGNFDKLNRACYRFLQRIKGANEYEMNDIVMRYVVSCICMNDYSNCFKIIEEIGKNYFLFDYNIYLFLLYFVQGKYDDACQKIIQIQNNISEDFYKYINEKDLAFYFSFCLLFNFNSRNYKQVLSNNNTLIYKLYDKYNEYFRIVDDYYKCDYLKVNSEFNKVIKDRIIKDPFLSGFLKEIENTFKKKILKEILSFTSEISFDTIQNLLLLKKKDEAVDMIIDLIKKDGINALIDDIEGIVIMKETKPIDEILEKSNDNMKKNLKELINFSLNHTLKNKLKSTHFMGQEIERKQLRGDDDMAMALGLGRGMGMKLPFDLMGI